MPNPVIPIEVLADIVQTLRNGRSIELPPAPGPRGMSWNEAFHIGFDRISGEDCLLHTVTGTNRDGRKTTNISPCFWSIRDLMEMAVDWPRDLLANLDDASYEDEGVQMVLKGRKAADETIDKAPLIDGQPFWLNGQTDPHYLDADPVSGSACAKWSLDALVMTGR